jgi:hypothetical protein
MNGREPLRVVGLTELFADLNAVDRELAIRLRTAEREAGDVVAKDAADRLKGLKPASPRSAAGVKTQVRSAGLVTVEQKLRKTTGKRPDWGVIQMMHAFLPALEEKGEEAKARIAEAVERAVNFH